VGSGGRLKKEWRYGKDKFDTAEPLLIQERDQQSKIIFQTKEPISQHKPSSAPPIDTDDDEDSEEDDASEEGDLIHFANLCLFIPELNLKTRADVCLQLTIGVRNTPQTPPDLVV
jgi:hypothetical protein